MILKTYDDIETASKDAAGLVSDRIRKKPRFSLCTATGTSPTGLYRQLAVIVNSVEQPLDGLRLIKLDEWGGLDDDDPASCDSYLRRHLLQPLRLDSDQFIGFSGNTDDPGQECDRIDARLRAIGQIDLTILGIGANGHLGFNEPGARLTAECHVASLAEMTLRHSMLSDARAMPSYGLTLGMGNILRSKEIVVLVFGAEKAGVLRQLIDGGITTSFPASFLKLHPRVHCFCDRLAATELS